MATPLRVLIVEDAEDDALLLARALRQGGFAPTCRRVDTADALAAALRDESWDIVLSDYSMPGFDGHAALRVVQESGLDLPFIVVSGTIGEHVAVAMMRDGAHDYLLKGDLARLVPAVQRELHEAQNRRAHRQAEQALAESEERLDLALRGADLGTWDWNIETGEVVFNERWAEMLGYALREIEPHVRAWEQLVHPDDWAGVQAVLQAHLTGRTPGYETEHRLRTKSGGWVWVLDRGKVVARAADGRPLRAAGTYLDITARKEADAERERLETQLRQAQKMEAVGQLAGGVAHDFNNILTTILGNAELVLESLRPRVPPDDMALQGLAQVERAAQRAATLTRQLLVFSRRDTARPEVLSVNAILTDMQKMLRRLITENIALELVPARDLHMVRADAGQLEQVVMNLVINARDAMPQGGRLRIETANVTLGAADTGARPEATPGPYIVLTISDTGCGMDADTMEHMFEPFFTTKPAGQGTGLGLATVYGIVQRSSGHIVVSSAPGQGATFRVFLPAVAAPADLRIARHETPPPTGSESVLVCEDDPAIRNLAAELLHEAGYTVRTAGSAREALALAGDGKARFDLLVTDVIMPEMNGKRLAEQLAARLPRLRTLFISGYSADVIAHHGVLGPDIDLLEKPFSRRALLVRVREVLDRQPAGAPPSR